MAATTSSIDSGVGEAGLKQLLQDMVRRESAKLDQETRELGEQCDQQRNGLARSIEAQTSAQSKVTSLREAAAKHEEIVSDKQAELDWAIEQQAKTDAALADAEQDEAEADNNVAVSRAKFDRMAKELTVRKSEVDAVKVNVTRRVIESLRKMIQLEDELEPTRYAPVGSLTSKLRHDTTVSSYEVRSNKHHGVRALSPIKVGQRADTIKAERATPMDQDDQEEHGSLGERGFNTSEGSITMRAEDTVYHDATNRVRMPTSPSSGGPDAPELVTDTIYKVVTSKPVWPKRIPWRPSARAREEHAVAQRKYEAELAAWMQDNTANQSLEEE
ncbi:hypothetical protein LTR15_006463 [Elasticomyces elasticus]|nr:hypothetical protein LTR15_006463 [Elasticomyces elasticus]